MDICSICVSNFNKTNRKPIECNYCKNTYCIGCVKTYLLSKAEDAHCMNCRTGWTMDFLFSKFPLAFIHNEYEISRAKIKLVQEKTLLPETQVMLHRKSLLASMNKRHRTYMTNIHNMNYLIQNITYGNIQHVNIEPSAKLVIDSLKAFLRMKTQYDEVSFQEINEGTSVTYIPKTKNEQVSILAHCTTKECRGFISTRGKCGLCGVTVCTKCIKEKKEDHVCNEDDIASVNLVRKDSKACPKCKVLIHRFEGCPQMWCTQCHTGFDWNTGEILKKLHNPHLTEWLMNSGNQANNNNNNICGMVNVDLHTLRNKVPYTDQKYIRAIYDKAQHFHNFEIPNITLDFTRQYALLRESYLLKHITEEKWVNEIKLLRKKEMRNNELSQILELFYDASMDIFRQFTQEKISWEITYKGLKDLSSIVNEKVCVVEKRLKISCNKYKV